MRKQKRLRITSNKEKFAKKNVDKNLHCFSIKQIRNNNLDPVCHINKKITPTCAFCGIVIKVAKTFPIVRNEVNIERSFVNIL